ncbi:MAG: hypothetical protein EGQ56_07970 [Clostridiales bacterium]|nr:hypothetical protein [Clostridiales bacterium]
MAEIKEKHPTWFKMRSERRQLVKELPAETTAKVLLACWEYLETAEIPATLNPLERIAFSAFFPDLEESWRLYEQRIKAKNAPNSGKNSPCIDRYHTMSHGGEEDSEEDTEEEGEEDSPAPASKKFLGGQRVYAHDSWPWTLADYLAREKAKDNPDRAQPTESELQKQAAALDELHTQNGVAWDVMEEVMYQSLDHDYWRHRVQSAYDFKRYFNKILADVSDRK